MILGNSIVYLLWGDSKTCRRLMHEEVFEPSPRLQLPRSLFLSSVEV